MTKKQNKQKNNQFLQVGIVVGIVLLGIIVYFGRNIMGKQINSSLPQEQTKTYQSKSLKLSLQIPHDWEIGEGLAFSDLVSNKGKINVSRIATNFNDLKDYLTDFDSKRKMTVIAENKLTIGKFSLVARIENFSGGQVAQQKVYFIFVDGWVYSLSTSSSALYNDLDQIARSFRYTP